MQTSKIPERKYTCPACYKTVTIGRNEVVTNCKCGELVFRPLAPIRS